MSSISNFENSSRNLQETINIVKSLGMEGVNDGDQLLEASRKIVEMLHDQNFGSDIAQRQLVEGHHEITAMIMNSRNPNSLDLDNSPAQKLAERLITFKYGWEAAHEILNSPSPSYPSYNSNSISSNVVSPTKNSPSPSHSINATNRSSPTHSVILGWDVLENKFQSIKDNENFIEDSKIALEIVAEKPVGSYLLSLPSDETQPLYTFSIFARTEEGVKEIMGNHNGEGYHLLGQKESYPTINQLLGSIGECTTPIFFRN